MEDADGEWYLLMKVVLIVGVSRDCRREEFTLCTKNIEDATSFFKIAIPTTMSNVPRLFTITEG